MSHGAGRHGAVDHDFHLFVESDRGVDSILYHAGPTGLRLAQVDGHTDDVVADDVPVAVSTVPAPLLDTAEAVDRLRFTGLPFLYHRYDGHYGLIDPQVESTFTGPQ